MVCFHLCRDAETKITVLTAPNNSYKESLHHLHGFLLYSLYVGTWGMEDGLFAPSQQPALSGREPAMPGVCVCAFSVFSRPNLSKHTSCPGSLQGNSGFPFLHPNP